MSKSFHSISSFATILVSLCFVISVFSQNLTEDKLPREQLTEIGISYNEDLWLRYDRYSKEKYQQLIDKLMLLKSSKYEQEWEGSYLDGRAPMLGISDFRLDLDKGFAEVYIYTCFPELRSFRFGKVINKADSISLITEISSYSGETKTEKYIKVRWADRLYLVEESALPSFAEKAVGLYVAEDPDEPYPGKWSAFWVQGSLEGTASGWPQFPENYKRFERRPLSGKVESMGKRSLIAEYDYEGKLSGYSANYPVTLNVGKNKGVKVGMLLYLAESDEQIEVTKVYKNTATGKLVRSTSDSGTDECVDDDSNAIPCKVIAPGLFAQTKVDYLY